MNVNNSLSNEKPLRSERVYCSVLVTGNIEGIQILLNGLSVFKDNCDKLN